MVPAQVREMTMPKFLIENTLSSVTLGCFEAETPAEALDALARDAGYRDRAHLENEVPSKEGEIAVTEIEAVTQAELDAAAMVMDDEIRENLHDRGIDDPSIFLHEYKIRHEDKYGAPFAWR